MTRDEFEKVYQANYQKALSTVRRTNAGAFKEHAEDAVSETVIYFLENLERFQEITPSYFIQKCVNRARNLVRNRHSDVVHSMGLEPELAIAEEQQVEIQSGRAYTPGKRND